MVFVIWFLELVFSREYFHFIATEELKKCKWLKIFASEGNPSDTIEFDHNTNKSYKCRGKSEYKHTICINGRWDPEVTCKEGKLFFIMFSKMYSISF